MKYKFDIQTTDKSKVSEVDFENLAFGKTFTDHMFIAEYEDGEWKNMAIKPVKDLSIHPANMAWHYGQSIFEGMKATVDSDGVPLLFRPEMHAKRINTSAERMCMPSIPEDLFVQAVSNLVALEKKWIPPTEGSALYIRPFMFATDEFIGVRPSETYKFIIITAPVGPYYAKPVRLKAEEKFVRAATGGVGEAKTAGNYAAALYPAKLAKEKGFDQVMWLDAKEFKYVQEVGTMNIFFVIDGKVVTPSTDGTILKGITRDCILTILKEKHLPTDVRPVTIDEVIEAHKNGTLQEVFGAGTAAVIAMVKDIQYNDTLIELTPENYEIAPMLKETINGIRSRKLHDKFDWLQEAKIELETA